MSPTPPAFAPRADAATWQRWLLYSPVARIVIFLLMFAALVAVSTVLTRTLGWHPGPAAAVQRGVLQLLHFALPAVLAYLLLVYWIERRRPAELSLRKVVLDGPLGLLAGLLLFSAVVAVLWALGHYQVVGSNPHAAWLPAFLVVGLAAGIGEEILMRGVLFRIAEEGLGTWWALLISALMFGGLHLGNPGATLWSSAAIAIEAGLLFGMLYHVTRSLPACMGLHAGWNFAQGSIYGIPVSGTAADGWLVSTRSGPAWLSGGVFGAEASVIALGLCSLGTIGLLALALRRGSLLPPPWRRAVKTARPSGGD